MSEFLWPWIALALPLPWILRLLLPAARRQLPALRAPFAGELARVAGLDRRVIAPRLLLPALVWGLLCLAAMRPVALGEVVASPASGRDLLLAVDVSGSMAADDMELGRRRVTRLTAVKAVVADFLDRRAGDRVGLLLFGQRPYLVTPLTFDRGAVRGQLLDSQVGIAGRETAIGDAIGLAVKRLREMPQQQRVLILLTDGVNTAGVLEPRKAAELAAAENVRIYAIGIGSEPGETRFFGMRIPTQGAEIDEETLTAVAEGTGGRYFRARDTTELAGIYAELDRLEPVTDEGEPIRPRLERYVWPLGAALALAGLGALAGVRRRELAAWC